jgi:hypothetical protein
MKKIALITISLLCSIVIQAQDIKGFVGRQLQTYPQLRLLDLYKSCFQDYMGAEHLVSDRQRVKAYLDDELNTTSIDDLMPWNYEPCGIDSNYYRVSIRTIKENVISENMLLDAFIRSANSKKRPTVDSWRDRWHVIIGTIDQMQLGLPYYQQDKAFIDNVALEAWSPLAEGRHRIFKNPVLMRIGEKYGKTSAQVALKFLIQNGIIIIPKTTHRERMIENIKLFDFTLSDEDFREIRLLDTGRNVTGWPSDALKYNPESV